MARLRWPVWFIIARSETPPAAAEVASPARRLWPRNRWRKTSILPKSASSRLKGLPLDYCQGRICLASLGGKAAYRPGIALVTRDPHSRVGSRRRAVQANTTRVALLHGRLGEPEDLLVGGRPARFGALVGALNNLEVAALLSWAVQNDAEPPAVPS